MRRTLKIYLPFASNELKRQLAYKGAFYLFILVSLFGSFISYYLWMAIYGSSENNILGGLTKNEMIVYVFMVYVTSSIVTVSISDWVSDDVVKGTVSMNLIKPIDYRASLIVRATGDMVYRFLAPGVFIWIGIEIYKVRCLGMETCKYTTYFTIFTQLYNEFSDICFIRLLFWHDCFFHHLYFRNAYGKRGTVSFSDRTIDSH